MRLTLIILTLIGLGFLLMVGYLYFNQRKLLYYPQPLDRAWDHIQENTAFEYKVEREGIVLKGWLINPYHDRLLVYYGGNAEEASLNIEAYSKLNGVAVLLMNYRGYGESDGNPTEIDLVKDATVILDGLKDRYSDIILVGRSLGSGVAVQVAREIKVSRLVLVTPYDSIKAVAQGLYPYAPVSWLLKDQFDSLSASEVLNVPALFLVAEEDRIIPKKHSKRLFDSWKSDREWVEVSDTDHNSISYDPVYWKSVSAFIDSTVTHRSL